MQRKWVCESWKKLDQHFEKLNIAVEVGKQENRELSADLLNHNINPFKFMGTLKEEERSND